MEGLYFLGGMCVALLAVLVGHLIYLGQQRFYVRKGKRPDGPPPSKRTCL